MTIKNGDEDEAWLYDKYDLNCFSLCLPCRLLGDDMHDDAGVAILRKALKKYSHALQQFTQEINKDLATKIIEKVGKKLWPR